MSDPSTEVAVTRVGGPTAIIELGGLRFLTDPTFDPPSEFPVAAGYILVKTEGPSISVEDIGQVDVVLLSHDQHADNLDTSGREFVSRAPRVFSTGSAAGRMGDMITPLAAWEAATVPLPAGGDLTVTAVPAQHGPEGSEKIVGEVLGFVLSGSGLPTTYFSGDNASLAIVESIHEKFGSIQYGVLNAGAARTPFLGEANLTLNGELAARSAHLLGLQQCVVVHVDGWRHFSEGETEVRAAFQSAGLEERLVLPARGERTILAPAVTVTA